MKILKPGREQKGWAGECECTGTGNGGGGCGAKLLVEEPDLYITNSGGEDYDRVITFKCIGCGVETDLKKLDTAVSYRITKKAPPRASE